MPQTSALYTTAQTNTVLIAAAATEKIIVKRLSVYCSNANTVTVGATAGFGTSGFTVAAGHPGIAAGSGFTEQYLNGSMDSPTLGNSFIVSCDAPTTGSIRFSVSYDIVKMPFGP